jgi:pimeloyl-ACP methyl ester carboxylesterase
MLAQFLDALQIDQADVIGNDSGGGISQIFAANNPGRVRSLTLTDCDTSDNWPPEAFGPFLNMAAGGRLGDTLNAMLADKSVYRSPDALGPAYENADAAVSDEDIDEHLRPFIRTGQRTRDFERFLAAFDNKHTKALVPGLRQLNAPTLIVRGTDDAYFPVKRARWPADTIPGARDPVVLDGARLFFPKNVTSSSTRSCART